MFTGIIESIGTVSKVNSFSDYVHLIIMLNFECASKLGDSIAINGACMTVSCIYGKNLFGFDVSLESLHKTNFPIIVIYFSKVLLLSRSSRTGLTSRK